MYKAIISDFDGTIVDHDLVLKKEVADKVVEFQQKGFIFTIASGRGYFGNLANAVSQLKISNPIIIRNGSEIIIPGSNEVIFGKYLEPSITSEIISYLIKENLEFYVEQGNYTFSVDAKPGKHAPNEQYLDVKLLEPVNVPKILIKVKTAVDAAKYTEYLRKEFPQQISIKMNPIKEGDYAIDINSNQVSKATAVEFLIDYLKLNKSEIVAIGDNMNDLPLFEHAGFRVAMGNSVEDLKKVADIVAESVSDCGIVDVIDKMMDNQL